MTTMNVTTTLDVGSSGGTAGQDAPLLELRHVSRIYHRKRALPIGPRKIVSALDDVSFSLGAGETLGVIGESGCGKSTLARIISGLEAPSEGQVLFAGEDVTAMSRSAWKEMRRNIQLIFQDPAAALDPRKSVAKIVGEPFEIHRNLLSPAKRKTRVAELLELVGLNPDHRYRMPHQFSGGQQQRIGIARGIALEPHLLVCDEAVSALDVSVRAQIVNLLTDLQDEFSMSYLFIAHDLQIVEHVSDRVMAMYLGRIAEIGPTPEVYTSTAHPYTGALLSAAPELRTAHGVTREHITLAGDPPSPIDPPSGCRFRTRCWMAQDICATHTPPLAPVGGESAGPGGRQRLGTPPVEAPDPDPIHASACHFADLVPAELALTTRKDS